jgi:hypothetical protein
MCLQIPYGGFNAGQIVQQAFRSLPMLEAQGVALKAISLPVLGTGGHGLNIEDVLRPILDGAQWALRVLQSAERICFVEINRQRAHQMSEAMDDVLRRVRVTVAKGELVGAIRTEIGHQIEKLDTPEYQAGKVVERLRRAIAEGGRSADVGMVGRLLREYVISHLLFPEDTKKMTPFETMQRLRTKLVAEWVISYLNLLHVFGNESAHHKTQDTHPPEIEGRDLVVCLFAIQRVLDFWFGLQSK